MPRILPRPDVDLSPRAKDMAALGRIVRNERAHAALRIDDAADLCGVTHDVVSKIENGRAVGLDKLFKVLDGLGIKMLLMNPSDADDALTILSSIKASR